jgi:hypothetical protein
MFKNKIISALTMATMLVTSSTIAATVDLPIGQTNGSFSCTVDTLNPFAKANIDTESVEVKGFCAGEPYVTGPGHLVNVPVSNLNDFFFEFKKDAHKSGTVTVTVSSGEVTCSVGKGDKKKSYGKGKYC